jgi:hypothetical protein
MPHRIHEDFAEDLVDGRLRVSTGLLGDGDGLWRNAAARETVLAADPAPDALAGAGSAFDYLPAPLLTTTWLGVTRGFYARRAYVDDVQAISREVVPLPLNPNYTR